MSYTNAPTFPGSEPSFIKVEITRDALEGVTVVVRAADGPGFITATEGETYEHLTTAEAYDVLNVVLSTLLGVPW